MRPPRDSLEVTVLGSGTSHGVPMIGCDCAVCVSSDPRDKRTRPSIYVRMGQLGILVDTAPELRLQCLANDITHLTAVLYTHHHADHVTGLDDLRRFNWLMKSPVHCYGAERTMTSLRRMFIYAFEPAPDSPHSRPQLEFHTVDHDPFTLAGEIITPIPLTHGSMPVLGFRIGNFAYCTDCNVICDDSIARLQDLDVIILDALRRTSHPAHFNLEQAVAMAKRIGARRTFFTHMTHQLGHQQTCQELPDGIDLAYDGLRITVR